MNSVAIFNDTSATRHYGCNAVMQALDLALRRHALKPAYYWPVGVDWRPARERLEDIPTNAIVVNGEGSIHSSRSRERARYLAQLGSFAKHHLGVPAALINCSVEDLDDEALDHLRNFDQICVRESASARYLQAAGIHAYMVADLSFRTPIPQCAGRERWGMVVTDSVLRDTTSQLRTYARSVGAAYIPMTRRKTFVERMHGKLRRRLPQVEPERRLHTHADPQYFLDQLAGAEYLITGRFHAVTLALATGTPFAAIESNTFKISALLNDVFQSTKRVFRHPFDVSVVPFTEYETAQIVSYMKTNAEASERLFLRMARLAAGGTPA